MSVRSPRKSITFIIRKSIFWVKYSKNNLFDDENKITDPLASVLFLWPKIRLSSLQVKAMFKTQKNGVENLEASHLKRCSRVPMQFSNNTVVPIACAGSWGRIVYRPTANYSISLIFDHQDYYYFLCNVQMKWHQTAMIGWEVMRRTPLCSENLNRSCIGLATDRRPL